MQIGICGHWGNGMQRSNLGVRRSKVKVTGGQVRFEDIILNHLSPPPARQIMHIHQLKSQLI